MAGSDYIGDVQISKHGKLCGRWDYGGWRPGDHYQHNDEYKEWEHNKCRNPDNKPGGAWCFLDDGEDGMRWDYREWDYCSQIPGIHFVFNLEIKLG